MAKVLTSPLPLPGIVERRDHEKKQIFSSCPGKGNENVILICLSTGRQVDRPLNGNLDKRPNNKGNQHSILGDWVVEQALV